MKKYDFGLPLLLIGIAVWFIRTSSNYGIAVDGTAMGAGEWPAILAWALILLSAVLFFQNLYKVIKNRSGSVKEDPAKDVPIRFLSGGMKRVYGVVGILALFYLLLRLFGFWIASIPAIPALMALMGERDIRKMAAITAGILLFIYIVFDLILGLRLPEGILF